MDTLTVDNGIWTGEVNILEYAGSRLLTHCKGDGTQTGFINATDLADYLVKKGLPFRSAYKISGQIVAKCIAEGKVLETLTLDEYKTFSDLFDEDLYPEIDLNTCVEKRSSEGGTSVQSVEAQIAYVKACLKS